MKNQRSAWLLTDIFLISLVATLGSLYYSTFGDPVTNLAQGELWSWGAGFTPCTLCWFARILMYPIPVLSYLGLVTKDWKVTKYILALSLPGVVLDSYHYYLQKIPNAASFGCTANNPCDGMYVNYFGVVTIPLLCLVAFVLITLLAVWNELIINKNSSL